MNTFARQSFVTVAAILLVASTVSAAIELQQTEPLVESSQALPFKLVAAGQIDLATGNLQFGGTATHIGLYTAAGLLNPADFSIAGTITAANGDTLDFTAGFLPQPSGEIIATFAFDGGTGRFAAAQGTAGGVVQINFMDFTFHVTVIGNLTY